MSLTLGSANTLHPGLIKFAPYGVVEDLISRKVVGSLFPQNANRRTNGATLGKSGLLQAISLRFPVG